MSSNSEVTIKTIRMKITKSLSVGLVCLTSLFYACTIELIQEVDEIIDDELSKPGNVINGISEETLNTIPIDQGEVGFSIDSRQLVKYGYNPTHVAVSIEGDFSRFSQSNLPINEYTHIALFKLKRSELSEDELKGLSNGVAIEVKVHNHEGTELYSKSFSRYIVNTTARTIRIETSLPKRFEPLSINTEIEHFIQMEAGTGFSTLGFVSNYEGFASHLAIVEYQSRFTFVKANNFDVDSAYHIKGYAYTYSGDDIVYLHANIYDIEDDENPSLKWYKHELEDEYDYTGENRFLLEQTNTGNIKIRIFGTNKYLSALDNNHSKYLFFDEDETTDLKFNLFAANIKWTFDDLGTRYSPAIIPPAQMDFAFEQTIINCSGATGDYTVGVASSEETSSSIAYEESMNLFSSETDYESATVEASADATFFGVGVSVSVSGTLATETTTEYGETKKSNESIDIVSSQEVSASRNVTVLPYSAVEVFDAIQKLDNVQIPFVQRFIIRGSVNDEYFLSGPEIEAQLIANRFGGVVTEVGSDYIVVSIRGAVNVTNYFEYNNSLQDIIGACS